MQQKTAQHILQQLFETHFQTKIKTIEALPASASPRKYFRLIDENDKTIIGVEGSDILENQTFIKLAEWFQNKNLNVPKILAKTDDDKFYLQEDLGTESLYSLVQQHWLSIGSAQDKFPDILKQKYQAVITELIHWQTKGTENFDFTNCQPVQTFDEQALHWDFNYFKYYFAKLCGENFNETALQKDFDTLATFLMQAEIKYFMHRDFQSRNIMFQEETPYFIDFQSGRRGPLYYDLASLLYQSSVQIPEKNRAELLDFYLQKIEEKTPIEANAKAFFYGFVTARLLQVLGAYGFRGLLEKKPYFLKSIPKALSNIQYLFEQNKIPVQLPELQRFFQQLSESNWAQQFEFDLPENQLTVSIHSFSYKKKGIPFDLSGNGGGFAFDCRAIHNPGRYTEYKKLTGKDQSVIDFLEAEGEIQPFFESAKKLVEASIQKYQKRNFQHLQIGFGCTGGQHRSVYCAEKMFHFLNKNYTLNLRLSHDEQHIYETN